MYWVYLEENDDIGKEMYNKAAVKELEDQKLIENEGDKIYLTPEGFEECNKIIRKHKLSERSERLFYDVLGMNREDIETEIYNFEYIMENKGEECTCTHLSYQESYLQGTVSPQECYNGSCKCAEEIKEIIEKTVLPLARIKKGQSCKIVYIKPTKSDNLHKILSIGVLPGRNVKVIQTYPSHVFQMEHMQIAVDSEVAENIFVGSVE